MAIKADKKHKIARSIEKWQGCVKLEAYRHKLKWNELSKDIKKERANVFST